MKPTGHHAEGMLLSSKKLKPRPKSKVFCKVKKKKKIKGVNTFEWILYKEKLTQPGFNWFIQPYFNIHKSSDRFLQFHLFNCRVQMQNIKKKTPTD